MKKNKRIILIILTIIWMLIIFWFSSQNSTQSSGTSQKVIKAVLKIVSNVEQEQENIIVEQMQHIVRKMAHFSIYMIGGILLINLVSTYTAKKAWMYAWLIGTMYAITDEIHQYFVPGRSCEIRDVVIDSSGVIIGIVMVVLIKYILTKLKTTMKKEALE